MTKIKLKSTAASNSVRFLPVDIARMRKKERNEREAGRK
jgi:hypothetical protein